MVEKRIYKAEDERINSLINEIAGRYASGISEQLLREMLVTIAKAGEEKLDTQDLKLINTTLKELRYAFRVFSGYRDKKKIAIFGSARASAVSAEYKMAEEFAKKISQKGFSVITGSGPGIMEAGNKGAGRANSFGVNIRVPFEQKPNPYIKDDAKLINFKYFFTRKLIFIKESDATVLFPGGFGTLDEGFEVITLFQTGKCRPRPILMLEPKGSSYWEEWLHFVKAQMLKRYYINEEDLKIFTVCRSVKEAVDLIGKFYKNYHSIRYIRETTVIRLNRELTSKVVSSLNKKFTDIIEGRIEKTPPLPEEVKTKEHLDLPRIKMHFNRRNFGRLKEFIDFINK